jgi:hypothetical protein
MMVRTRSRRVLAVVASGATVAVQDTPPQIHACVSDGGPNVAGRRIDSFHDCPGG